MNMEKLDNKTSNHWMPFSANRDFKAAPRIINKAEGVYYYNIEGGKILDGSSGLFNCPLGHCQAEIATAITTQLQQLDYAPHFNTGHAWGEMASAKLCEILPKKNNRLFFVNSGSESIDTAIKMSYAYWCAKGQDQKTILISRDRAYHGTSLGSVALSGIVNNRRYFHAYSPQVFHMRHTWLEENRFSRGLPKHGVELADDLLRAISLHGAENIAACFVEPIAGSYGAIIPPKGYLQRLRKICDEHDILLIFDEVITGFARTGKWFASDTFAVEADIITMAKAITNGVIPMGAVAAQQKIYDAVIDSADKDMIEFFHGHTCSAHPVACAALIATVDTMLTEKVDEKVQNMSKYYEDALFSLQDLPVVYDIRNFGLLGGIELKPKGKPSARGSEAYKKLFWEGLHIKATSDNIIPAPAYVYTEEQIDEMIALIRKVLSRMKV